MLAGGGSGPPVAGGAVVDGWYVCEELPLPPLEAMMTISRMSRTSPPTATALRRRKTASCLTCTPFKRADRSRPSGGAHRRRHGPGCGAFACARRPGVRAHRWCGPRRSVRGEAGSQPCREGMRRGRHASHRAGTRPWRSDARPDPRPWLEPDRWCMAELRSSRCASPPGACTSARARAGAQAGCERVDRGKLKRKIIV